MRAADLLPDLRHGAIRRDGLSLPYSEAGDGPPVLLLHGHPQSRAAWRRLAPRLLAEGFRVVAPDLRGYGEADVPADAPDHAQMSKRTMAADAVALLDALGIERAHVVGHDRGARVGHRMAADHPGRVASLAVLDVAPTKAMYEGTTMGFARDYVWWFLLIQPAPFPEELIAADPARFLRRHLAGQTAGAPDAVEPAALAHYERCYVPARVHAICEDYRAAATIDLAHDAEGARVAAPVLALWSASGAVGRHFDVAATWRALADRVEAHPLDAPHALPEAAPDAVAARLIPFLRRHAP